MSIITSKFCKGFLSINFSSRCLSSTSIPPSVEIYYPVINTNTKDAHIYDSKMVNLIKDQKKKNIFRTQVCYFFILDGDEKQSNACRHLQDEARKLQTYQSKNCNPDVEGSGGVKKNQGG